MLGGSWGGAVAKLKIAYLPDLESIVFGLAVALLSGLLVLFWSTYQQSKVQLLQLLQPGPGFDGRIKPKKSNFLGSVFMERALWVAVILIALMLGIMNFLQGRCFLVLVPSF